MIAIKTIDNIKKVSLVFFIVTGIVHLGSSMLIANEYLLKEATIANTVMDVPFVITGMLYGFASLRLSLTDPRKNHKVLDIILISITIITLIALVLLNILIPDIAV